MSNFIFFLDILQQQGWNSFLVRELESPHVQEEQEVLLLTQEEELITLAVKTEDEVENRETVPAALTSTEHMEAQGNLEDHNFKQNKIFYI